MATVISYTAAKIDEELDETIVNASYNAGTGQLTLTKRGGGTLGPFAVKGAASTVPGPAGADGEVLAGGYVGTLQDAIDDLTTLLTTYSDDAGKGLVAWDEQATPDQTIGTGVVAYDYVTVTGVSASHAFVLNRSYRISFGCHVEFGPNSDASAIVNLDLLVDGSFVRRAVIPGSVDNKTCSINGSFVVKQSLWNASKACTLRISRAANVDDVVSELIIKNTSYPAFVAIEDIGGRFV
jgi:hypothetical protein